MRPAAGLAVLAALAAGCGQAPPPPSENPLLFSDFKAAELYKQVDNAETAMTGEGAKLKDTCRKYFITKARAQAAGVPAGRWEADPQIEASCEPYRAQLARRISAQADMQVSAPMFSDPLVWAKYREGRVASVMRYDPDGGDDPKATDRDSEKDSSAKEEDCSDADLMLGKCG